MSEISGSQGYVKRGKFRGQPVMIKWSKYVDYTIELERTALTKLVGLNLPHFVKPVAGKRSTACEASVKQRLYMEEIRGESFRDLIAELVKRGGPRTNKLIPTVDVVQNITYQTLCACAFMHGKIGMSHNDLHTSNVLIRRTDYDIHVYKFDEAKIFAFKTYGFCPVVIDFGYSCVPGTRMMAPPHFTDIGYSTHAPDHLADARILLNRVAYSFLCTLRSKKDLASAQPFVTSVNDMFGSLKLNQGWFPDKTFVDLLHELKKCLYLTDYLKTQPDLGVFDPTSSYCDDAMSLVLAQIHLPISSPPPSSSSAEPGSNAGFKCSSSSTEITLTARELARVNKIKKITPKYSAECITASVVFKTFYTRFSNCIAKSRLRTRNSKVLLSNLRRICNKKELVLLKHVFDASDEYLMKKYRCLIPDILKLKKLARRALISIRSVMRDLTQQMDAKKAALYDTIPVKSVLEALTLLPIKRIAKYKVGMKVMVFDYKSLVHKDYVLTRDDVKILNATKI